MSSRIRIEPQIRDTETYRDANFLRLYMERAGASDVPDDCIVTLEHLSYEAGGDRGGWRCETIVDRERMSAADALFIAKAYAREHRIPVIYECHGDKARS